MQIARAGKDMTVAVERGRNVIQLRGGEDVVMHDVEIQSGMQAGAFDRVEPLPVRPVVFSRKARICGPVVMPFIGGLGDAIAMLPVIEAIRRLAPDQPLVVSTTPGPGEIFSLSPVVDLVAPYPMRLEDWVQFETYVSMECVQQTGQLPGRGLSRVFAAALDVNIEDCSYPIQIPGSVAPSDDRPMVGIAIGAVGNLRSPPQRLIASIVDELVTRRVACVLLGDADDGVTIRRSSPLVEDLRGKTPRLVELAVWLKSMNAVVAHDSLMLHLAGAMQVPTIGLFAPTSARMGDTFDSVLPVKSNMGCSPCHAIGTQCPQGHDRCLAWESPDLAPAAIATKVMRVISAARSAIHAA